MSPFNGIRRDFIMGLISSGVLLKDFDIKSHMKLVPMQKVPITYADTSDLERDFGYKPSTSLRD